MVSDIDLFFDRIVIIGKQTAPLVRFKAEANNPYAGKKFSEGF
jgi:hypothetical protein